MATSPTQAQIDEQIRSVRNLLIGQAEVDDVIFIRVDTCCESDMGLKRERYYTPDKWEEAIQTCQDTSFKSWVYLVDIQTDEIVLLRRFI